MAKWIIILLVILSICGQGGGWFIFIIFSFAIMIGVIIGILTYNDNPTKIKKKHGY